MNHKFYDTEKIFLTYISTDIKNIDKYIEDLAKQHFTNSENIKKLITKISKTRSLEEQEKYRNVQEQLKKYHKIRKQITFFINTEKAIYLDRMISNASKKELMEILKDYLDEHPEYRLKIKFMLDYFDGVRGIKLNDNTLYLNYLEGKDKEQSIVNLISILFCKSEEEALALLSSYNIPRVNFENYIKKFAKIFPTKIEDTNYLKNIYSKYADKEKNMFIKQTFEKVNDIYLSSLCIEEYCSVVGNINIKDVKKHFSYLKSVHNLEFDSIIDIIEKRDNSSFYLKINEIAKNILLEDEFDLLDYYKYTKLGMQDFIVILNRAIEDEKIKEAITRKILRLRTNFEFNPFFVNIVSNLNNETELKAETIINGRKIEKAEKQQIIDFIEQNRMHRYNYVYNYLLQKYASGELDLNNPQFKLEK